MVTSRYHTAPYCTCMIPKEILDENQQVHGDYLCFGEKACIEPTSKQLPITKGILNKMGRLKDRSLDNLLDRLNKSAEYETHDDGFVNAEVAYSSFGDADDVLHFYGYTERPVLNNRSSVLIKVEASTVCLLDCQMRRNTFFKATPLPHSPGTDCIGTVHICGDLAHKYGIHAGDRVAALSPYLGGNARYVTAFAHDVVKVPKHLDAIEAVCLIRSYVTAYQCLHRIGNKGIQPGDKVLVTGGNGCVGRAVVELALLAGAGVVFATASRRHHKMLKGMGAVPLGLEREEWLPEVKDMMDVVIDTVGGVTFEACQEAVRRVNSKVVSVGLTSLMDEAGYFGMSMYSVASIAMASWNATQTYVYDLFGEMKEMPEDFREDLQHLFSLLNENKIQPRIADCVPLVAVAHAHNCIEEGGLDDFLVCLPWKRASYDTPRMKSERPRATRLSTSEKILRACAQTGATNQIARFFVLQRRSFGHTCSGLARFVTGDY